MGFLFDYCQTFYYSPLLVIFVVKSRSESDTTTTRFNYLSLSTDTMLIMRVFFCCCCCCCFYLSKQPRQGKVKTFEKGNRNQVGVGRTRVGMRVSCSGNKLIHQHFLLPSIYIGECRRNSKSCSSQCNFPPVLKSISYS